jgi:hypothetical protein
MALVSRSPSSPRPASPDAVIPGTPRAALRERACGQPATRASPNYLLNPSLTEPQSPRCSSRAFRSPLRLQRTTTEPIPAPSRHVAGALAPAPASAVSHSTIHNLFRNHSQFGPLGTVAPQVGSRFFCQPRLALPDRCIQRAPGSGRLRSATTPSTRRHTLAFPNAFTRRRALESASVCLQGWRSRSDWKTGGRSRENGSADSIERQQRRGRPAKAAQIRSGRRLITRSENQAGGPVGHEARQAEVGDDNSGQRGKVGGGLGAINAGRAYERRTARTARASDASK